jgi:hypothetical protein
LSSAFEARRIGPRPGLDALHRRLLQLQFAALDQRLADRLIGMAVLVTVVQAHHAAVGQLDPAGTLHLQEEEFDGIIDIEQRTPGSLVARAAISARDQ